MSRVMRQREKVPERVATAVLVANKHTCCICNEPRKHVETHHIDGDTANNAPENIAVLCRDCHSRVTGDEGLGRRYSESEVSEYKRIWEGKCCGALEEKRETGDEDEGPVSYRREVAVVHGNEHATYDFCLDAGQKLIAGIWASDYIDVSVCERSDYKRWLEDGDLMEYEGAEEVLEWEVPFVAPHDGNYVLLVINHGDQDVDFGMDVTIWDADEAEN